MKALKVYIVTYKRPEVLNDTLNTLFNKTDFKDLENTEVTVINNHSDFTLNEQFKSKVNVLHNMTRPDWSTGNLGRNWNEALIHGFKDLNNPDAEIVVTMQNDIVLHPKWASNLLKMHEKYTLVAGQLGDNIVSYKPEAVKKIGLWDEKFCSTANKEADYYIRALIFNKDKTLLNDKAHGRLLNNHDALPLETGTYRGGERGWVTNYKSKGLDAWYYASQYFYHKWKDTWKTQPAYRGWLTKWPPDFVENPPKLPNVPYYVQYYYFEKDVELHNKNAVGWRKGDFWLDLGKHGDIDTHPSGKGQLRDD